MTDYEKFRVELLDIEEGLLERYPDQEDGIQLALAYALHEAKKYIND